MVIKANDVDSGLNALLHYDILEIMPRRYFHIDSTTGAIKTVMLLDHEKIPVFNFHVKVSRTYCWQQIMYNVDRFMWFMSCMNKYSAASGVFLYIIFNQFNTIDKSDEIIVNLIYESQKIIMRLLPFEFE